MNHSHRQRERRLQVQKLQELPPLPLTAQDILRALNDDDIGLDRIAAIIKRDPGLAARIIGLANSAFFGTRGIETVEQAIIRSLGLAMVKSLSLSMVMGGVFDTRTCRAFDLARHWKVALLGAYLAELMAHRLPVALRPDPKQAYLCGLLYDLGLLAMVTCFPQEMTQVFTAAEPGDQCGIVTLEWKYAGIDHHEAGAWLGRKWHLPEAIVLSIESKPPGDQSPPVEALSQLSHYANHWACLWVTGPQESPPPDDNGNGPGFDPTLLEEIQQTVSHKYDALCELASCMST